MGHTAVHEDVREAVLDAADRLFQHYGYKKTTVEDIAQEARMSRGTVYLYFHGKEEIALSWVDRYHQRVCAQLRQIAHSPGSPAERLREMLLTRVLTRFDAVQHYTQSIDSLFATMRTALLTQRDRNQEMEAQIFAEVLQEGQSCGAFARAEAPITAHLLILATNSLLPYSLSPRQLGERAEIEAKARGLAALLLDGLHRCGPSGATAQPPSSLDR